jgi:hypothetical protein
MKTILIITIIIWILQIVGLLGTLMSDSDGYTPKSERGIQSKSDVLIFFIPYFWVPLIILAIIKWWKGLK